MLNFVPLIGPSINILMNICFIFPGYLTSVDSYMNLQVLPLVFGSLAVVLLDLIYLFFIVLQAHHSFNMEEHAKKSDYYLCYWLQLANTEEYIDGQFSGNLGEILIR